MFGAPAQIADHCRACGYDFAGIERGGRLAGLVTIIMVVLLFGASYAFDALFNSPIAVQMAIWAPVTVGSVLYALRFYKTLFLYAGYESQRETALDESV